MNDTLLKETLKGIFTLARSYSPTGDISFGLKMII